MFLRSSSGIANSSLFFGSDRTVYVEGDGSDERFWREIFKIYYQGPLTFHFKSLGSRTAVEPYAEKIATGTISNAIAILDSDFELLKFSPLPISNIIYSFGYSYENDLFSIKQAIKLASQLHSNSGLSRFRGINKRLQTGINELRKIVQIDLTANLNGDYFLPKNGNTCRLNIINKSHGVICKKSIESLKETAIAKGINLQMRPSLSLRKKALGPPQYRWVYGHLWRAVFTKCVSDELSKNSGVNINSQGLERLAVSNITASNGQVFSKLQAKFYKDSLARIK